MLVERGSGPSPRHLAILLGGAVTAAGVWRVLTGYGRSRRDGGTPRASPRTFMSHRAEPDDRAALAQLVLRNHLELSAACPEEWLAQLRDLPTDFAHLLDAAEFARGRYRVAKDAAGRIVGAAGITPSTSSDRDGKWVLTAVTVAEDWRRLGIAQHLVRLALQDAQEAGAKCVAAVTLLELMEGAWRLYERLGFRRDSAQLVTQEPRPMTVLSYELHL
jgi:ribosomal protein S18 acetylase RimI-like enzyme